MNTTNIQTGKAKRLLESNIRGFSKTTTGTTTGTFYKSFIFFISVSRLGIINSRGWNYSESSHKNLFCDARENCFPVIWE